MEITREGSKFDIVRGIIIGIGFPLIGYYVIKGSFSALISAGLMDDTSMGIAVRRFRTISLIAICCNMIPMHFLRKTRSFNLIRGLTLATMVLAGAWIYYFRSSLYQ